MTPPFPPPLLFPFLTLKALEWTVQKFSSELSSSFFWLFLGISPPLIKKDSLINRVLDPRPFSSTYTFSFSQEANFSQIGAPTYSGGGLNRPHGFGSSTHLAYVARRHAVLFPLFQIEHRYLSFSFPFTPRHPQLDFPLLPQMTEETF